MTCWRSCRGLPACAEGEPVLTLKDIRQTTDFSCGRAVLYTVWDFYGVPRSKVPVTPIDGLGPDTLESLLWQSGLSVQAGGMDVDDLQYHTKRGRPVVACVTEAGAVGHWVVVGGVSRGGVFFQCPIDGWCREPVDDFIMRWTDQTRRGVVYARWGLAVG